MFGLLDGGIRHQISFSCGRHRSSYSPPTTGPLVMVPVSIALLWFVLYHHLYHHSLHNKYTIKHNLYIPHHCQSVSRSVWSGYEPPGFPCCSASPYGPAGGPIRVACIFPRSPPLHNHDDLILLGMEALTQTTTKLGRLTERTCLNFVSSCLRPSENSI